MTFVDQTKDNILGVQAEIQDLRATVDMLASEVREDREAQKQTAAAAGRTLNKTINSLGEKLKTALKKDDAVEAKVTEINLRPKEPPKLRSTDFGEGHADWKHQTFHAIQFWNSDVADLMQKRELSFHKWDGDENEEFWLDPDLFSANEAGSRLLSAAVRKKARMQVNNAMSTARSNKAHQPTAHDETSDEDTMNEYPAEYKALDAEERQEKQQEHL